MKKTSEVVKKKSFYRIDILIDNTAYIKSSNGQTGLYNIKTKEVIGDMDFYYTQYDTEGKFFIQTLGANRVTIVESKGPVRIYDALNERMIAEKCEIVKRFKNDTSDVIILKSPVDGKKHLFDQLSYRNFPDVFDMALDDVEKLYTANFDTYFVLTIDGKKGLYHSVSYASGKGLVVPVEFDNIELNRWSIIFTKNGKQRFVYYDDLEKFCSISNKAVSSEQNDSKMFDKFSDEFDSITFDEHNKNIMYCKKGNETTVYYADRLKRAKLLAVENADVEYCSNSSSDFKVMRDNKVGLISSKMNEGGQELLPCEYDKIEQYKSNSYYLYKNGKTGLFVHNSLYRYLIEPNYDNVTDLGGDLYALYTDGFCDIESSRASLVKHCESVNVTTTGIIFKQYGKHGLVPTARDRGKSVIDNEYDNITCIGDYLFLVEKDAKKGLVYHGEVELPTQYDDIQFKEAYGKCKNDDYRSTRYYLSLREGNKFKLAKIKYGELVTTTMGSMSNREFDRIDFLEDIMVLKDQDTIYVYDYNENLVAKLPASSTIMPALKPVGEASVQFGKISSVYLVDGEYYGYKDGKFEKVSEMVPMYVEEREYFVTTYETDTGSFEVSSSNKREHDEFCQRIDALDEEEAEKVLSEMPEGESGHILRFKKVSKDPKGTRQ